MAPAQRQQQDDGGGKAGGGLVFEQFAGINTSAVRAGVPDEQAYWLDGFMPTAPRQLRILWGVGEALYTAAVAGTILCYYFYNIKSTAYVVVFLTDGSAVQVNTSTGATKTIFVAGTLSTPSITNIGVSQYGQDYLLIVSTQTNGYWVWDGGLLYTAGTLAPVVTITDVGSGYTSAPAVNATGGSGSGATFAATITNGTVTNIVVTDPGSGYVVGDTVTLTISGTQAAGVNGVLTAVMAHQAGGAGAILALNFVHISTQGSLQTWTLNSVTITSGGAGYQDGTTTTTFVNGTGAWLGNSAPTLALTISGGVITAVTIHGSATNPLSYYLFQFPGQVLPTGVTVTDPGYYFVTSVTINNGGTGYGPNTSITVSSGGTPIYSQAVLTPSISGGVITAVNIKSRGAYGSNVAPTLVVNDTAVVAIATVNLMPFGINGNAVQTYQGSVWVFNGPVYNFTAPGSVSDFATSSGGGSGKSSDNFLRIGYVAAIQTNGFLFLIGDSSMNYISGVQTTGSPPTTTFTNQNSDPEIGTPYPASAVTLGQEIFIANATGIFVSSGGAFVKRSDALDGVYYSVPNFGGLQISAAKATIFGKRIWMALIPVIDPITGVMPQVTSAQTVPGSAILNFASVPAGITAGMLVTK